MRNTIPSLFKSTTYKFIVIVNFIAQLPLYINAQTAFNDPNGLDLSMISADKFLYFDMQKEMCIPSSSLESFTDCWCGNTKIYLDEVNSAAYAFNLFSHSFTNAESKWVKMQLEKTGGDYILSINKFTYMTNESISNTFEYIRNSEIPDYITDVDNHKINPVYSCLNEDKITFKIENDRLEMCIPDDMFLIETEINSALSLPIFNGFKSMTGERIYPNIPPAGTDAEDWTMTYTRPKYRDGHETVPELERVAKIIFDGDVVYLGNIENSHPDCWLKGKIENDKITFTNQQLYFTSGIGGVPTAHVWCTGRSHELYLNTASLWKTWYEEYYSADYSDNITTNAYIKSAHGTLWVKNIEEDLTFDYDAENGILFNPSSDFMLYANTYPEEGEWDLNPNETSTRIEVGLFCDVMLTRGDTTPVKAVISEDSYKTATNQKIFNLQGIQMGYDLKTLPPGLYIVINENGSRVIKK